MSDIVKRLRSDSQRQDVTPDGRDYTYTATPSALEIEAAAEIERLRAALRMAHRFLSEHDLSSALSETALIEASEAEDAARAALEGKDG